MVTVERYFQHHMRLWIDELKDNMSILDVGCGTGKIGYWLAVEYPLITANCLDKDYDNRHRKKNIQVTGIDSYRPALKYIKELGNGYTFLEEIDLRNTIELSRTLKYTQKGKFDIALAYGVLAHLEKKQSIDLIYKMLTIADHVIVTAPSVLVQHENIDNSKDVEQLRHKSSYVCKDLENCGLNTRMLAYNESSYKMTFLNTFISPYTFILSAIHARKPFTKLHLLNHFGDGMIGWR